MSLLSDAYRAFFRRARGFGFGLGVFNRLHRLVWEGWLQPDFVEVDSMRFYLQGHDEAISDCLRMGEEYESAESRAFKERLRPGMTVFDLGANIGFYSVLASRLVGPAGRVYAFEPDHDNLWLLQRNIRENGCRNVEVCPYAVSESLGFADLYRNDAAPSAHSIAVPPPGSAAGRRVVSVSLDGLFPPEVCPDFVKMDIEGAEFAALRGMRRMLADPRLSCVVLECLPSILEKMRLSEGEIAAFLTGFGFTTSKLDAHNMLATRTR
ncbi:FkbM family methyltransferase [bacterium]|nr:MAG: FkbM family methyltransferase [bacterium]